MQANLFLKKWVLNCEGYIYCVKKSVKCSFILTKKTTTCKLIRWVDGAELSPLHQCSLCRRRHVKTTWKLLCGEAVTPPKKKQTNTHTFLFSHLIPITHATSTSFCSFIGRLTSFCHCFPTAAVAAALMVSLLSACAVCND